MAIFCHPGSINTQKDFFKGLFYKLVIRLLHKPILKKLFKAKLVNQTVVGEDCIYKPCHYPVISGS